MSGTLYLVATPIGNLGDFSPRAVETLEAVDFIAAEDTRVSVKLLNHFQIKKPLVSYHQHNHATAGKAILDRLLGGESCALVTDAGTPAISDPGEDLVRLCAENGVEVVSIPGCCAAVNALAVSGAEVGAILRTEAVARAGCGKLRVTGVVEQEEISDGRGRKFRRTGTARDSAEAARTALAALGVRVERYDVHINFPGGALVDGPSAGLAMAVAMRSAIAGEPVAADAAMTGEISVTGAVLPVGGVRAKVRAAARARLRRVLIPWDNRDEAGAESIEVIPVRTLAEALELLRAPVAASAPSPAAAGVLAASPAESA